ncbi:metallophosphoesterase [Variovorax sp. CCNWLW225]|jgi:3',5'-cyclic AMP phosphodiesterase CpdA|uniref:metallophosphoesterase family protein n=1 Tax=unclassified Variovorax TaxID=663243 RepID=UPI00215D340A|nr:metallophosphoesterase [Variovorax sp. S12S4]MCR8957263.1 metallophosphoesterase [Variovorax sp. S12S4]
MNSCLLQISDTHFGTEQPEVMEALERLAHSLSPQAVVLSGDITQRATRAQFAAARAFIDRLAPPALVAIPGNHDIPLFHLAARLFSPYERYTEAFGTDLEPVFESAEWLVVAVNTTRWYRHEDGEVSPAQVERVEARLAAALPSQLRVVVTHQPVMVTRQEDMHNRLHGRETAVARWCAAGADLILGGHIHLPFVRSLHDAYAGCPRTTWAVQAGTAVSSRVRAGHPNSVNVLRMENIGGTRVCQVERWDHSAVHKAFVCGKVLRLRLASGAVLP